MYFPGLPSESLIMANLMNKTLVDELGIKFKTKYFKVFPERERFETEFVKSIYCGKKELVRSMMRSTRSVLKLF